nr:MAG TPA: hypothetical protein [Caudoviricetes sp.]
MATALDLLMSTNEDVNLLSEESDICTIDAKTRVIFVPSTIVVGGVQSDKNAERIKFSCPKIVGDNLDLSKFSVRINFENVSSVDFNVSIKDQYICDDVAVDGENVTFSWLIGRNAARYMGTVRFIVCAVKTDSDSNISVEWNTAIAEVPVLEGIEIDQPQIEQEEKDVINQLLELTKNTSAEAVQNVNSAKEQAIKDIQSVSQPDTTLTIEGGLAEAKATGEAIGSLKEDLADVRIKYTNLFNINPNIQDVIINGNIGSIYVNENYIDVEEGKPYFVYVKFKITNLINWIQGYVYARLIYTVDAGGWENTHLSAIKNNSEFSICYNFIAKKSGKVGVQLYFNNQLPSTNTFNCQCIKLFVAQTSDDIKELVELEEQTNSISKIKLKPKTVTWDNLSNDVKEKIERTPTNYTIIDCWGDSLTQGAGATNYPYPTKLQELIGEQFVVNNYGQGSETAEVIAFRQGGMGAIVLPFTASTNASDYNKVTIKSINGASLETMSYSGKYYGNDIVYLNGADKWLFRRGDSNSLNLVCVDGSLLGKKYSRPTIVFAEGKGIGHVAIICIGQNGWAAQTSRPEALADIIQKMIEHNGSERYIVVGRPTGNKNERNVEEIILASRFSNHFVNAREYISAYGLSDNGLSPTQEDTESMSSGAIPPKLRIDAVHMNDYGYTAMANCIFNRGVSLGYWQ